MEGEDKGVYARKEGIVLREIAGEHLLVPIRHEVADMRAIFALNRVGLFIWERLDGERGLDRVLVQMLERFAVPPEEAAADLSAFVERLKGAGLVEKRS